MRKRWMLSTDGGVTYPTEVFPINGARMKWSWQADQNKGRITKRITLQSDIEFGGDEYAILYPFERNPSTRCNPLYVKREWYCRGFWREFWVGRFSAGAGSWNIDNCTMSIRPDTLDRYTCFIEAYEQEHNVLEVTPTPIELQYVFLGFVRPLSGALLLYDVMVYLLDQTGCEYTALVSDFFEWNPIGDAPGYSSGINYVTGITNVYDRLYIDSKSNVVGGGTSEPSQLATIGKLSLAKLLEILRQVFNVYWTIDDSGNFRIEHIKHWVFPVIIDATTEPSAVEDLKYMHLSKTIPSKERFQWEGAISEDFFGKDIIYSGACVLSDGRDAVEETIVPIITDTVYWGSYNTNLIGFVMMATRLNFPSPDLIINDIGELSGTVISNAPMCWANLHRDLFTWNRYLRSGNMNGADIVFDRYQPNVEQEPIRLQLCCDQLDMDMNGRITTRLGQSVFVNKKGEIDKAEFEDINNTLTITPRYSY